MIDAQDVLRKLAIAYPTFWDWAQHVIDVGILTGRLSTVFGWPIHVTDNARPTALRNYPMQANGAEMLRLSCCLATERGSRQCAHQYTMLYSSRVTVGETRRRDNDHHEPPWPKRHVTFSMAWRSAPTCLWSRLRIGIWIPRGQDDVGAGN